MYGGGFGAGVGPEHAPAVGTTSARSTVDRLAHGSRRLRASRTDAATPFDAGTDSGGWPPRTSEIGERMSAPANKADSRSTARRLDAPATRSMRSAGAPRASRGGHPPESRSAANSLVFSGGDAKVASLRYCQTPSVHTGGGRWMRSSRLAASPNSRSEADFRRRPGGASGRVWAVRRGDHAGAARGCSSMVEPQPSKLVVWVRFPSPAPPLSFTRV